MNKIRIMVSNWKQYWGEMKKKLGNEAGLTLIELMVVVVILGIIAAIAIPSISSAISSAKVNSTESTLATMQEALQRYYTDHDAYPAELAQLTTQTDATGAKYTSGTSTTGPFGPYLSAPTSGVNIEKDAWGAGIYYYPSAAYSATGTTNYSSTGYWLASLANQANTTPQTSIAAGEIYCAGGSGTIGTAVAPTTPIVASSTGTPKAPITVANGTTD